MEKQGCEAGDGDGCKHKGCADPAVTWRVRRGRITLKGGIAARTKTNTTKKYMPITVKK